MNKILLLFLCLPVANTHSFELTGRSSILGTTALAQQGDIGYINKNNILTSDQQSLRLMLDETSDNDEWSFHIKMARQHLSGITLNEKNSSKLFRYKSLSSNWLNENEVNNTTRLGYEVDRAVYKKSIANMRFSFGRQAIDWGSGRFWQPLNVFGSFTPTDLDTDYKQGIDAARFDWFPSNFSSLSAVYAFSPSDNKNITQQTNSALHYQQQIGDESNYTLLAGSVIGYHVIGASFESAWSGMGWRIENAYYHEIKTNNTFNFLVAGVDYQFNNQIILTAEWYNNSRGARNANEIQTIPTDLFYQYGLQPHLSQNIIGLSLSKVLSPLFNGSYTLLASPMGKFNTSFLQQININYSISNESELLFSLQWAQGRGLNMNSKTQSEFGHIPASFFVRIRFYF